jgi:pSer/pThr/pTyr-binding forkhead associated (FHA) protein
LLGRGGDPDPPGTVYELVVLEGADSGAVFTLDEARIQIGRRIPGEAPGSGIGLTDRSVSSRHALVSFDDGQITVEHLPSATNPTLVNGRRIKRKRVRDGDRIVLGLVVLELRARRPAGEVRAPDRKAPSEVSTDPVNVQGELVLRDGIDELRDARFPLIHRRTSIGRSEDCEISLDVSSISRVHAALVWEDDQLVLIHESAVNPTHVNGMEIRDRRRVFHGDEIRVAERVVFEVRLEAEAPATPLPEPVRDEEATRLTRAIPVEPPAASAGETRLDPQPDPSASPPASDGAEAAEEATRIMEPASPDPGEATPAAVSDAARTVVQAPEPEVYAGGDETRIAPVPAAGEYDEGEATRIEDAPAATDFSDGEATRIADAPSAGDYSDGEATRIADAPSAGDYSEGEATRIANAPSAGDYSEGEATRIADAPSAGDYSEGEATRIADAPSAGDYSEGEATRIAPAPDPAGFRDGDATRIAPVPGAAGDDATPRGDAAPEAAADTGERTRVVDLDAVLGAPTDAEKTVIRPSPAAATPDGASDDDARATVVRPMPDATRQNEPKRADPQAPAAETVIIPPDEDED